MGIKFIVEAKDADNLPWHSFVPGCYIKVLGQNPETGVIAGYFKMDPHSEAPEHDHPSDEFDYVLEGEVEVNGKMYGPGTLFHRQAGVIHGPHITHEKSALIYTTFSGPSGREESLGLAPPVD
ncbi:MAG: cupin domain-containing protein [Chloroflexi bacterium]|nr:cupin domain-containing protein [Chloroflexota bacterium]